MATKLIARIIANTGIKDIIGIMVDKLSLPDLQSLFMEIYRKKAEKITYTQIMNQYEKNRFVQTAQINPEKLIDFDKLAYELIPENFDKIVLSPLAPLGTVSRIAPINQNNIITTTRNTELVSDSTNVMALESAKRRRKELRNNSKSDHLIKLCTSHRQVRGQTFEESAAFPHFSIFALTSAGRDTGSFQFEEMAIVDHISFYLNLLKNLSKIDLHVKSISIKLICKSENLKKKLYQSLKNNISLIDEQIKLDWEDSKKNGNSYYEGLRFQIYAVNNRDEEYFLVDGGFVNWTQLLLSNKKERLLTSGIGSERLLFCFGK